MSIVAFSRSRSAYASTVSEFLECDHASIVGMLSSKHVVGYTAVDGGQIRAWERELNILDATFRKIGLSCYSWSLLIEVPLFRLRKRLDVVVLAPGVVFAIEFKVGKRRYEASDRLQTEYYAQALRDFHESSQRRLVVPILCATDAPDRDIDSTIFDGVADLIEVNASSLAAALTSCARWRHGIVDPNGWGDFEAAAYRPTPTIIEAAQALYAGHQISELGRGDAIGAELERTAQLLRKIVRDAEERREKVVCFVTGAPGAGKTLLGLDLSLKGRSAASPSALLSGNPPLVRVLTEVLVLDASKRENLTKRSARESVGAAIQTLLGYLKQHADHATPPEHVIVFDEAQRAWNADVGLKLMGRARSEPEEFLLILDRLDWACLVCLVGPGQEINRGEGGLALWGEALAKVAKGGQSWRVIAAPQAAHGGKDITGPGLLMQVPEGCLPVEEDSRLHLSNSVRAYRNALHGQWVTALLDGDLAAARTLVAEMNAPPAFLTRNLDAARMWLRQHRRGGRTTGLLASSGAVRLIGDGIPPAPQSNQLDAIANWFLKPSHDFRSSGAGEIPMSEFGCQGLELDYVALCWGGDLIWTDSGWMPRQMRAPHWNTIRDKERRRYRLNAYRVLLTRARAGTIIYVPAGSSEDPTRSPCEFSDIAEALRRAGCRTVESDTK